MTGAQDQVMANMEQAAVEHNIQRVVEKQTKELQVRPTTHNLITVSSSNQLHGERIDTGGEFL